METKYHHNKSLGMYSYADGEKYDGEWKHGEKHGTGNYSYTDGAR